MVISDNSGDPDKSAWLAGLGPDVTIVPDGPPDAAGNLMAALACVKTPFFMPVGDDDLLSAGISGDPPDYRSCRRMWPPCGPISG